MASKAIRVLKRFVSVCLVTVLVFRLDWLTVTLNLASFGDIASTLSLPVQHANGTTSGEVAKLPTPGRFMVFPFTHYGPNVQLLALRQSLCFCKILKVPCIEPGFYDLFKKRAHRLGEFYNFSGLNMVPRLDLPSPLKPNVFIYGDEHAGGARWPSRCYWPVHNISHQINPSRDKGGNATKYARTVRASVPSLDIKRNINWTLTELRKELAWFQQQPPSNRSDHIVALVYPALFGHANNFFQPPEPLATPFREVFAHFQPKDSLVAVAEQVIHTLFPGGEKFLAVHLRLRDHCNTTIEECCCETSANQKFLSRTDIERFIDTQRNKLGVANVFISGPPALERMAQDWDWVIQNSKYIKFWYSDTAPGSHEESLLQQIICSKATGFFYSNPASTWGFTLRLWQAKGTILGEVDKVK